MMHPPIEILHLIPIKFAFLRPQSQVLMFTDTMDNADPFLARMEEVALRYKGRCVARSVLLSSVVSAQLQPQCA
jgi:hypothetical protein